MYLMRFFSNLFSSSRLGIDIGTTSLKAVEVAMHGTIPQLLNYGILESRSSLARANTVFQSSSLQLFDSAVVDLLKQLIRDMKPRTKRVVASIPSFAAFVTVLDFPQMSDDDLARAVSFKAREVVPLPIDDVALDFVKVGDYHNDQGFGFIQVLLVSIPKQRIAMYQKLFQDVGLTLDALEVESMSLVRSVIAGDPSPTLIVDIGSRATAILCVDRGALRYAATTDFAGASLTQALTTSLQINPIRAEELKRERGLLGSGPERELSTIMRPFVDAILQEVKRVSAAYETQVREAKRFERIILTGGGANLNGLPEYVSTAFGVPAVLAAPLSRFSYPSDMEPLTRELGTVLAVALGLGIRES